MMSKYKSWYPDKTYSDMIEVYFDMIEAVFQVQLADSSWDFIHLTSHQREFHSTDITIQHENAKYRLVDKSRNTSFTVSSIISLATGNYHFRDEIVPLVRINEKKVIELVSEAKKIIKHMRPIKLENGDLWPFDPNLVKYNALSIEFPDRGVIWQGYPALSPDASELVRSLRTTRGLIDEGNYIRFFKNVYTAMRDSKRGASLDEAKKVFHQITIGTTLKGFTNYYYWREDIIKKVKDKMISNFIVFSWPIFDPEKFNLDDPLSNIDELKLIVPWHSILTIKDIIIEDWFTFLEEYMAVVTPDEEQFYNVAEIMDLATSQEEDIAGDVRKYFGGCDPSGEGSHFFAISVFKKDDDDILKQILLNQKQRVDLDERERYIRTLLNTGLFSRFRIDGNGLGYHTAQSLKRDYPDIVEVIRGNVRIKAGGKNTIGINEYLHTNQKIMIKRKQVEFLDDELQYKQYAGWNRAFKAEENKIVGHCDSTISNGLALLPLSWRKGGGNSEIRISGSKSKPDSTMEDTKSDLEAFYNMSMKDRIKQIKRDRRRR